MVGFGLRLSKGFVVRGSIIRIFELTKSYVVGMKYAVEKSNTPNLLVLKRGGVLGSLHSFDVENVKTILTISFTEKGDEVHVMCDYDATGDANIFTSSDKSTLESEVAKLHYFLLTSM